MLLLDRSGNWWLDGEIIEPWEIMGKWTEIVNAIEAAEDKNEAAAQKGHRVDKKIKELLKGNHLEEGKDG